MNLVLDTSILIDIQRNRKEIIQKLDDLRKEYPAPPKLSFISYFEFLYGLREKSEENKKRFSTILELFGILQTTNRTAEILVELREKYELPLADLMIAAQVIESKGILVTKDKDFGRIKELSVIIF